MNAHQRRIARRRLPRLVDELTQLELEAPTADLGQACAATELLVRRAVGTRRMRSIAAAAALALSACAAPSYDWVKLGSTDDEAEQAKAQCAYEAEAIARRRTPGLQTIIGAELDRADHRNELIALCMKARGFTPVAASK
jgi:hypothetical protein